MIWPSTGNGTASSDRKQTPMGDQLYLLFIKEQALVPELMKLHPICTLLGGQGEGLDNAVKITSEQSIGMHRYLTEDDTIDVKKYQDLCEKNLKVS